MTRDDSYRDREQLERMVSKGLLTLDEAARLQNSLDQLAIRDQANTLGAGRSSRRHWWLLGVCTLFTLLGLMAGQLLQPAPGQPPAAQATQPPVAGRAVRPIDLDTLSDERRRTMAGSARLSGAVFLLIIAAVIAGLLMALYNRLIDSRESVNAGWAQVENVYQRRLDLVPVLIDTVQTYMEHERDTLQALTEARAQALGATRALGGQPPQNAEQMLVLESAQGELQSALTRFFAVVENYPDLKASQNFLTLQDQIEGTENRIAMERRQYNEYVRAHNARVQKFPTNIVAGMMDFSGKPYFKAEDRALQGLEDPFGRADGE